MCKECFGGGGNAIAMIGCDICNNPLGAGNTGQS